ncbi:MAG: hypothetical protein Tsb0034_21190 [Ekhidna sp.]
MKPYYLPLILLLTFCSQQTEKTLPSDFQLTSIEAPSGEMSSLPYLVRGADDKLYMSWVEKQDSNQVAFKYAYLNEDGWSAPELIASGNDWFVNWADYPMLAVDKDGNMIAHYLAKSSSGTYSYDINIVLKPKDSTGWSTPIIPHQDGTPTEHGFVTMLPNNDGTFTLAWLDGRNTGGGDHSNHGDGAMTVRSAVMNMNGEISEKAELDARVCDCCQTGGAITANGSIIVYRDRSVDEIRDMAFVTKTDEGWSEPQLIAVDNWNIAACPVNGPRVTAKDSTVAAAWYTGANGRPTIKIAFKQKKQFNPPIIIDNVSPLGRVDVILKDAETAFVSWLDGGDKPAIKFRKVNINGAMTPEQIVSQTSEARGSGFPQMELYNDEIYFAWTQLKGESSKVLLKKLKIEPSN